jgi:hypothetical protein
MFSGRKKPVLLLVVVTALALLLPLLAYLQYDWLGKVSEEITRVFTQFSVRRFGIDPHRAESY